LIVITLLTWIEECPAGSMGWHWSSPLTVVPSHSSLVFVKRLNLACRIFSESSLFRARSNTPTDRSRRRISVEVPQDVTSNR